MGSVDMHTAHLTPTLRQPTADSWMLTAHGVSLVAILPVIGLSLLSTTLLRVLFSFNTYHKAQKTS